jgi:hypothetical protein
MLLLEFPGGINDGIHFTSQLIQQRPHAFGDVSKRRVADDHQVDVASAAKLAPRCGTEDESDLDILGDRRKSRPNRAR